MTYTITYTDGVTYQTEDRDEAEMIVRTDLRTVGEVASICAATAAAVCESVREYDSRRDWPEREELAAVRSLAD